MAIPSAEAPKKRKTAIPGFAQLQRVGRSLMLPIAVLPAAALLMRFGQPDMLGADGLGKFADWLLPVATVFAAAGTALFDNLPLIFAVGVAIGFAKKADGSTALAAVAGYLVMTSVFTSMSPVVRAGVPAPAGAPRATTSPRATLRSRPRSTSTGAGPPRP